MRRLLFALFVLVGPASIPAVDVLLPPAFPPAVSEENTPPVEPRDPALIPVTPLRGFFPKHPPVWMKLHRRHLQWREQGPYDLVLIGDSITQGWGNRPDAEVTAARAVWERHFGRFRTLNLGIGGDRTQNVVWRLERGEVDGLAPKAVVLAIGVNNIWNPAVPVEAIAAGILRCVDTLRAKLPAATLLVLAVLPTGETADHRHRRRAAAVNAATEPRLRAHPDFGTAIRWLDLGPRFLDPDGRLSRATMPDFLHPNAAGYELYAAGLEPALAELLR